MVQLSTYHVSPLCGHVCMFHPPMKLELSLEMMSQWRNVIGVSMRHSFKNDISNIADWWIYLQRLTTSIGLDLPASRGRQANAHMS